MTRGEAIDALDNLLGMVEDNHGTDYDEAIKMAIDALKQPERKKGKWIRHSIGHENTPWGFDCSACGKWFVIGEDTAEQYNFCPNCGAEMKGEEE